MMINKATLLGRLGQDAEIHVMTDGEKVASLSVATSETWKDKESDEWKERTEWHRVVTYQRGLVSLLEKRGAKGALVYIEGQLRTRTYRKDGEDSDRYATEVILTRNGVIRFPNKIQDNGDAQSGADSGGSGRSRKGKSAAA